MPGSEPSTTSAQTSDLEEMLRRSAAFGAGQSAKSLARNSTVDVFLRDRVIFGQQDKWPYLGFVCEGFVGMIVTTPAGREHMIYEAQAGETFGDIALLDGGPSLARGVVISPRARIATIPRADFLRALDADRVLAREFAKTCANRARSLADRLAAQSSKPTIARIAAVLLTYAATEPGLLPAHSPVRMLRQGHLAALAGTVKEVVARAVGELEAAGALARERGHIVRLDRTKLTAFLAEASATS